MSVTQVNEIWKGRDGSGTIVGVDNYTRVYRVLTNSGADTAKEVLASGVPQLGDVFPNDPTAFCQRHNATQESFSDTVWIATFNYSNEKQLDANPLLDPAVITWSTQQFQKYAVRDKNGDAIVNSAGQLLLDPPIELDDSRPIVTISKNLASAPPWLITIPDTLNETQVTIDGLVIGPEKAKINSVSVGRELSRNLIDYRVVTIAIHLNRNGWQPQIVDAGFFVMSPDRAQRQRAVLDDATDVTVPVMFDGNGNVLADPTAFNQVNLTFDVYETFDFNTLPLT